MESLIESIVTPIVDVPEEIHITKSEEEHCISYHLTVHPDDVGKVIGKNGRVAKAIRTIVYASNTDPKKRLYLNIM